MSELEICPVTPGDAEVLISLARDFHREDGHPLDPAVEPGIRKLAAGDPVAPTWIIRQGGAVIGYVALSLGHTILAGGPDGFIDDLYLVPAARGRGIGRRVLAFVEAEARARGYRALHLEVEIANTRAQRIYAAAGYEASPRKLMTKQL
ncbi:GNAT family N-acetyltransferase [Desertibaculum subflavum]|uniref:GNAT family N-acetyltransferase n=1 Tax=Desertibaculum subflavum TaxID=2268458 RepID=UPI000E675CEB